MWFGDMFCSLAQFHLSCVESKLHGADGLGHVGLKRTDVHKHAGLYEMGKGSFELKPFNSISCVKRMKGRSDWTGLSALPRIVVLP